MKKLSKEYKDKKIHLLNLPDNRRSFLSEAQMERIKQLFYDTTATLFLNF
jgi:hypothetical protein